LSKIRKITNGVIFRSPRDGQTIDTGEVNQIQNALGADVIMAFRHPERKIQPQLLGLTAGWVLQLISGLTKHCLELCRGVWICAPMQSLAKLDLPGYAIGGVSVGEPRN